MTGRDGPGRRRRRDDGGAPTGADRPTGATGREPAVAFTRRHVAHRAFRRAHAAVAFAWVAATAGLAIAARLIDPGILLPVVLLGSASGILAHLGLLPGTLLSRRHLAETSRHGSPETADAGVDDGMVGWLAGALIRVFGTVAIFGLARYHMPHADRDIWILGTVLGFYAGLTALEVWVLARILPTADDPSFDSPPGDVPD